MIAMDIDMNMEEHFGRSAPSPDAFTRERGVCVEFKLIKERGSFIGTASLRPNSVDITHMGREAIDHVKHGGGPLVGLGRRSGTDRQTRPNSRDELLLMRCRNEDFRIGVQQNQEGD